MKKLIMSVLLILATFSLISFAAADIMQPSPVANPNQLGMGLDAGVNVTGNGFLNQTMPSNFVEMNSIQMMKRVGEFQREFRDFVGTNMQAQVQREMEVSQREDMLHIKLAELDSQRLSLDSRLNELRGMGLDSLNSTLKGEYSQIVFMKMETFFQQVYQTASTYSNSSNSQIALNASNLMQLIVNENDSITVNSTGQEKMSAFMNVTLAFNQFKQNVREYDLQYRTSNVLNQSLAQVQKFQTALNALSQAGFNVTIVQTTSNVLLSDIQFAQQLPANTSVRVYGGFLFAIKLGLDYEKQALIQAVTNSTIVTTVPMFLQENATALESSFNVSGSVESAFLEDSQVISIGQMGMENAVENSNVNSAISSTDNSTNSSDSVSVEANNSNDNSSGNYTGNSTDNNSTDNNSNNKIKHDFGETR